MSHYPVLLSEVMQYVGAQSGKKFVDATAGGGGHTKEILTQNHDAVVLGLDWDGESLAKLQAEFQKSKLNSRVILAHSNYAAIAKVAQERDFGPVDGIILDLGFSSLQLDDQDRGFSFQNPGPLDMRYDRGQELTAEKILNEYSQKELEKIFKQYGEENHSSKIARDLVVYRKVSRISASDQVFHIIKDALPAPVKHKAADSVRRIFQALRIEVNHELDNLSRALPDMFELLAPKGRLVVISFHSLEDRIVKNFFLDLAKGCICPPDFPQCVCGMEPQAKILTKKPVTATESELAENPRSKPAKLRAIEKI